MISRISRGLGHVLAYGYAIVFVLTLGEVVARYAFNSPTPWTLEIALIFAGLHYILSGPQASADGSHIRITTFIELLPPAGTRFCLVLAQVVALLASCLVCYWATRQAAFALDLMEKSGTSLNTPLPTILKVALAVSFALMALQALVALRALLGRKDSDA